jgi:hypothetical protein
MQHLGTGIGSDRTKNKEKTKKPVLGIRSRFWASRIRIWMFLGFQDPDPLVKYLWIRILPFSEIKLAKYLRFYHKNLAKIKFLRLKIMCLRVSLQKKN